MEALRILIADDHAAVRRAIRSLLESKPKWEVCSEATNGREAIDQVRTLRPDVVVLDVMMPELNGLEAMRQILKEAPGTQVLILTIDESEELAREVIRSGAQGIVAKSAAHELLILTVESILRRRAGIHLADSTIGDARHVGAFFQSHTEAYAVLIPFMAEGLLQGQKVFHFFDPADRDILLHGLQENGVDVPFAQQRHQLELFPWDKMYRGPEGEIDYEDILSMVGSVPLRAPAEGFPLTRMIGSMEWALKTRTGPAGLAEFEDKLDQVFDDFDDVIACACAFDLSEFDSSVITDVMRRHPAVVIDGTLRTNPSYRT